MDGEPFGRTFISGRLVSPAPRVGYEFRSHRLQSSHGHTLTPFYCSLLHTKDAVLFEHYRPHPPILPITGMAYEIKSYQGTGAPPGSRGSSSNQPGVVGGAPAPTTSKPTIPLRPGQAIPDLLSNYSPVTFPTAAKEARESEISILQTNVARSPVAVVPHATSSAVLGYKDYFLVRRVRRPHLYAEPKTDDLGQLTQQMLSCVVRIPAIGMPVPGGLVGLVVEREMEYDQQWVKKRREHSEQRPYMMSELEWQTIMVYGARPSCRGVIVGFDAKNMLVRSEGGRIERVPRPPQPGHGLYPPRGDVGVLSFLRFFSYTIIMMCLVKVVKTIDCRCRKIPFCSYCSQEMRPRWFRVFSELRIRPVDAMHVVYTPLLETTQRIPWGREVAAKRDDWLKAGLHRLANYLVSVSLNFQTSNPQRLKDPYSAPLLIDWRRKGRVVDQTGNESREYGDATKTLFAYATLYMKRELLVDPGIAGGTTSWMGRESTSKKQSKQREKLFGEVVGQYQLATNAVDKRSPDIEQGWNSLTPEHACLRRAAQDGQFLGRKWAIQKRPSESTHFSKKFFSLPFYSSSVGM